MTNEEAPKSIESTEEKITRASNLNFNDFVQEISIWPEDEIRSMVDFLENRKKNIDAHYQDWLPAAAQPGRKRDDAFLDALKARLS
jgi:hypothetical protein